ncbi:unnamed protein product [Amoebophrya sp. A120]|nr:unnamed protein product [Amoebophrya sp. A120]|eukprot:GSA120T00025045001.1
MAKVVDNQKLCIDSLKRNATVAKKTVDLVQYRQLKEQQVLASSIAKLDKKFMVSKLWETTSFSCTMWIFGFPFQQL